MGLDFFKHIPIASFFSRQEQEEITSPAPEETPREKSYREQRRELLLALDPLQEMVETMREPGFSLLMKRLRTYADSMPYHAYKTGLFRDPEKHRTKLMYTDATVQMVNIFVDLAHTIQNNWAKVKEDLDTLKAKEDAKQEAPETAG